MIGVPAEFLRTGVLGVTVMYLHEPPEFGLKVLSTESVSAVARRSAAGSKAHYCRMSVNEAGSDGARRYLKNNQALAAQPQGTASRMLLRQDYHSKASTELLTPGRFKLFSKTLQSKRTSSRGQSALSGSKPLPCTTH